MNFRRYQAFSLVEVTLALGVVAFAVVAMLGVLPLGLSTHRESKETQSATLVMGALAARLRLAAQSDDPARIMPEIDFPKSGDPPALGFLYVDSADQSLGREIKATSIYRVRTDLRMPSNQDQKMGLAFVQVSWPATATNSQPMGAVEATISLPPRKIP